MISKLSFILKAASEGHNVINELDGDMDFVCLYRVYRVYKKVIKANVQRTNSEESPTSNLQAKTFFLTSGFSW